jgi:hypothetical protein
MKSYNKALIWTAPTIDKVDTSIFYHVKSMDEMLSRSKHSVISKQTKTHHRKEHHRHSILMETNDVCSMVSQMVDQWSLDGFFDLGQRNFIMADLIDLIDRHVFIVENEDAITEADSLDDYDSDFIIT